MKQFLKILRILLFLATIPAMVSTLVWANKLSKTATITGAQYHSLSQGLRFVEESDLDTLMSYYQLELNQTPVRQFAWPDLENGLNNQAWIDSANVYVDADRQVHIVYKQRQPYVRIVEADNLDGGYYLDAQGDRIQLSDKFLVRVPVATMPLLLQNNREKQVRQNLIEMSRAIMRDSFWSSACSQLDVKPSGEIQMVPAMGKQIIRLGDATNIANKLARLTAFYRQGYNTVPWNVYNEIDVRFEGQVIGRNTQGKILSVDPYDKKIAKMASDSSSPKINKLK